MLEEIVSSRNVKVKAEIKKASKSKVPVSHIREATDKAQKPKETNAIISWFKNLFGG
jgi:transcriptional/translational regulatory protein YebC/TACO1